MSTKRQVFWKKDLAREKHLLLRFQSHLHLVWPVLVRITQFWQAEVPFIYRTE